MSETWPCELLNVKWESLRCTKRLIKSAENLIKCVPAYLAIRIFISQLFDIVSKSVTWDEWDLFLVTNTWGGSCFWSRLSNLIQVRIRPAFLKCEIVRGWVRGNQRTFSSAFGEFQTSGPPTVLQLTMQGIQPSVLCTTQHSRGRCAENILQMDF